MVAKHLTIRNLTATAIELKQVERFAAEEAPKPDFKNITRSFSTLMSNITRSDTNDAPVPKDSKPFAQEDVSVHIKPFEAVTTKVEAFVKSDKERLRLTFDAEGEKHQIQIPVPTSESATMKALANKPRFKFTGIYVTPHSHLAIYSSANLNAWMKELKDDTLASAISIPGTHNSPTCHVAAPSVRCQAVSPREQLDNGVRFFDIRVCPQHPKDLSKDNLMLVHSVFPVALTGFKYFRELVDNIESFLEKNPSETLIMSVKREGPGEHTDEQLCRILRDHYVSKSKRWYTQPKIPTLGEARGKIVLIRRFGLDEHAKKQHHGRGWGIDAGGWADNTPYATCPSGCICLQDFYEVLETENIDKKIDYIKKHIGRSAETSYPFGMLKAEGNDHRKTPFYINFLSASNFWKIKTWPEKIAAKVNPAIVDYLCREHKGEKGDWGTGILVCDWVGQDGDWDLVRCIVGMNTKLMIRQRQKA